MLPKKHPLIKVIANLETLNIATTDPLFIDGPGNSYPHSFDLIKLITEVTGVPETRAVQLGCKPALFSENFEFTKLTLLAAREKSKQISVTAWMYIVSNSYLILLFGVRKNTRFPNYTNRFIRTIDRLSNQANARWVTHLLCNVGIEIFKEHRAAFDEYLDYIFCRTKLVRNEWIGDIKVLDRNSTVQELLNAFILFNSFQQKKRLADPREDVTATEAPVVVEPVHPLGKYFTGSVPFFEIAVQVHSEIMHFKQIGFNSAKQMLVESTADYALVMIGDKWLVGLMPANTTADHIARALSTLATVKSIWLSKLHVNKVMMLQDSVYTTDGTYLIKFTDKGFIPYGPIIG